MINHSALCFNNSDELHFCPVGSEEMTGESSCLQPVHPGDRITSQCIRMMRAPAHSHSYYQTQKGGQSLWC